MGVPNLSSQLILSLNPSSQLLKLLQSQLNIRELWPKEIPVPSYFRANPRSLWIGVL